MSEKSVPTCDGQCSVHHGVVRKVRVVGEGAFSVGLTFNYCEEAIAADRANGFTVEFADAN